MRPMRWDLRHSEHNASEHEKGVKIQHIYTIIDKTLSYASESSTLTKRDRKQLNIFERKMYRRILGPVYDNAKENWMILTNKKFIPTYLLTYLLTYSMEQSPS
jgi:hypothetical protein